ncbi:MAG: hypothetical protein ABW078_12790 [Sedimenticola sp.]
MSNFKLNLPTEIPWERICVTEDMVDKVVCDERLPGKWRSSIAVFKYRPEDDYQEFDQYNITYLKVTATLTGYQPIDKEIQGNIDWDGVDVTSIPGLTDLLNAYNPCHGAILQVVVGPRKGDDIKVDEHPFFMDFEPKKRELYEVATDTREKQSRSIQSLNTTKSSGSTQSLEVLDVDMGSSFGLGMQGSYAGTGGGFNVSSSSQGQWGTKRLNSDQSMSTRSQDVGEEKRESFSFSTQLSQMYHLLDSYHLGTNRVVFFVQPRPHTLEEPSGFVRGPRPVEGIQEFFLIVAQKKDQKDFCVSVRLDTSHLTTTPIMDYDRKTDISGMASATAPIPTRNDTMGNREKWGEACFIGCWDMYYQCYLTHDEDDVVYQAPDGYVIESYSSIVNSSSHGSTSVSMSPDRKTLTVHAEANGKICFEDTFGCVDCPDEWQKWAGSARRQVQVNLVSEEPTRKVGEQQALMITTRGLCCCPGLKIKPGLWDGRDYVVEVAPIPDRYITARKPTKKPAFFAVANEDVQPSAGAEAAHVEKTPAVKVGMEKEGLCEECGDKFSPGGGDAEPQLTIRQANELSDYMKTEAIKALNNPNLKPKLYTETEFFGRQLQLELLQLKHGRKLLWESVPRELPKRVQNALEKHFRRDIKEISRRDMISLRNVDLAKIADISEEEAQQHRLRALGVAFKERGPKNKAK